MRFGAPMAGRLRRAGITTGLGADAVTSAPGDMFSQMRAALMSSHFDGDAASEAPTIKAADVLRMATAEGAAALGLGDEVGSLGIGKRADLILLRADALNLTPVTHDPIGAVVTAAHPGNVDTVLVDGRPVKRNGRLLYADLGGVLPRPTARPNASGRRAPGRALSGNRDSLGSSQRRSVPISAGQRQSGQELLSRAWSNTMPSVPPARLTTLLPPPMRSCSATRCVTVPWTARSWVPSPRS